LNIVLLRLVRMFLPGASRLVREAA
jgi:hypothetical protein